MTSSDSVSGATSRNSWNSHKKKKKINPAVLGWQPPQASNWQLAEKSLVPEVAADNSGSGDHLTFFLIFKFNDFKLIGL